MIGYKFLEADMTSHSDRGCRWTLNEWKTWKGELEVCRSGFHCSKDPLDALEFADYGPVLCVVETAGKGVDGGSKAVFRKMRVVRTLDRDLICRKFAIACARHVLPIFEKERPKDDRPRKAIEAAEAYLKDPTPENEKKLDAARAAARAAAWAAARDAARDAAWAAAWAAARAAAWAAARAAAWAAARDAAWAAARDAERKWQRKTLLSIIAESP